MSSRNVVRSLRILGKVSKNDIVRNMDPTNASAWMGGFYRAEQKILQDYPQVDGIKIRFDGCSAGHGWKSVARAERLRSGIMNEPAGGETAEEHKRNKPKNPVDEAFRPSHVLGGKKNVPAPTTNVTGAKTGTDPNTNATKLSKGTAQEGLRKSGNASSGVGGLQ
ncbi:hypothetical protein VTH82DRAFT_6063 [Thermothelomyces myriococcoides]